MQVAAAARYGRKKGLSTDPKPIGQQYSVHNVSEVYALLPYLSMLVGWRHDTSEEVTAVRRKMAHPCL